MLRVEIADTPYKQANGLMFRTEMPEDSGMIFVFKKADTLRFWGVNTYLPLDIAFVDEDNRITQIANIKPLSDRSVVSDKKCKIAIEANLGYFERNKICVGDTIQFEQNTDRVGYVDFKRQNDSVKTAQFIGTTGIDPKRQPLVPQPEPQPAGPEISPENAAQLQQQQPPQQMDNPNGLPVIDISNLEGILEDSYDEGEPSPEDMIAPEPQDQQPEISPEQMQQDEPQEEEIPVEDESYPKFGTPAEALNWAQQNHEAVFIWYTTKGGRDIKRVIEPHGQFVAESTGNPIVVTFDQTIGDIRAFIVPRVMHYSFVGEEFQPKFVVRG